MSTALVSLNDLNGKHYLGTQEGEILIAHPKNVYLIPEALVTASNPLEEVKVTEDEANSFLLVNVNNMLDAGVSIDEASIIALHRLFAVKHGLVSDLFQPNAFSVEYREVIKITVDIENSINNKRKDLKPIRDVLTKDIIHDVSTTFYDRVCLVAFVFRARGHHYLPDYQQLYSRVWNKCRYATNQLHISFLNLATLAFHAIFPIVLDQFWTEAVINMNCNGALSKRYDVAPAGSAGPYVLHQGILDIEMVAPGLGNKLKDAYLYLNQVLDDLRKHRFNGSVNARYYAAQRVAFDEKRVSAIAATIYAALNSLTDNAPLADSPALQRIANNAPITGAILGKAIRSLSERPEVVNVLLLTNQ
jgi:hypothetical protein